MNRGVNVSELCNDGCLVEGKKSREDYLLKGGYVVVCLFFLVSFISKAALNSLGAILMLLSVVYSFLYGRDWMRNLSGAKFIALPVIMGAIFALFSNDGGVGASLEFLNRIKFFVLPLILAVFIRSKRALYGVFVCVLVSAVIATAYSILNGNTQYGVFQGAFKLERTASLVLCASLALVAIIVEAGRTLPKIVLGSLVVIAIFFHVELILFGIRGAWVGYVAGLFFILALTKHRVVTIGACLAVMVICLFVAGEKTMRSEVVSIFNTKTNASNNARLHLWRAGFDFSKEQLFFGTGVKGVKKEFKSFFNSQPKEYQRKYFYANRFRADFHNNFIQILVECGVLSLLSLVGGFFALFGTLLCKAWNRKSGKTKGIAMGGVAVIAGFLAMQFFHLQLFSYGSVVFYLVVFCGLSSFDYDAEDDSKFC